MNAAHLFLALVTLAGCECVPRPRWPRLYIPPHLSASPFSPPGTPPDEPTRRKDTTS